MQHFRWKPLNITSTKKPFSTHLLWEHATYGILMVDSTDQTVLLFSTKARLLVDGSDWDIVDLSDNTNSYKIQAGWPDGNDLWLVMCDNDGTADDFEVCFIERDDSNDCNPIAVSAAPDANSVYVYDIFVSNGNTYVINRETRAATETIVAWDVDTNPFVEKDTIVGGIPNASTTAMFGVVHTDTTYYSVLKSAGGVFGYGYGESIDSFIVYGGGFLNGYTIPADNLRGLASAETSGKFLLVLNKTADGKNYLYSMDSVDLTEITIHDVALQLDRNNSGSVPNELEKAFGIANKITYEIKARRGGITQLQDLSAQLSGNIVGLTDSFLFAINGVNWEILEFQNIVLEMSNASYNDGIIKIPKKAIFTTHPDFHINWSEGDSIKWYGVSGELEFWGEITNKNQNNRGLYVIKVDSFTNEIYRQTYQKSYSGDDLDTKQKDIIDNGCDFCYRSSSIVGTTQTFDYVYNRAIVYMFWFGRRFERQVPYIEPDGKIWTKAHDGLVATGKSWDLNDKNQEVFLIDIPRLQEHTQGFFDGNTGITRNTIRYKNNATVIRPVAATRDPIEQLKGILPLNEFRDPKLEAATEANQLGDNRYAIWSKSTIFLGLRIEGQGYLQPGQTIEIENTGQTTISQDDFLILSFIRDPIRDLYTQMILSDNIIFPSEFNNKDNTSRTQVHTASVQAIENQNDVATNTAAIAALDPGDKTKRIPILNTKPDAFVTPGAGNTYWVSGFGNTIRHGVTSAGSSWNRIDFRIPLDYKSGTDIYLKFFMLANGGAVAQVDSNVYILSRKNGQAVAFDVNAATTLLSPTAIAAGATFYLATITLSNASLNFEEDDFVGMAVSLDDNAAARTIDTQGYHIEYTSENLD